MDVYQDYILVTYKPFDVHIFHVKLFGELTPSGNPDLQVNALIKFISSFFQHALFLFFKFFLLKIVCYTFLSDNMTNSFLQYENFQL